MDNGPVLNRILFSISIFHSLILERRKFGAVGFTEFYNFNDSDLE
jgi:dynein heavy chain